MTITIKPKSKKELAKIKAVLVAEKIDFVEEIRDEDWWNELSDYQKKMIEEGEKDFEEGRIVSHEELMKSFGR